MPFSKRPASWACSSSSSAGAERTDPGAAWPNAEPRPLAGTARLGRTGKWSCSSSAITGDAEILELTANFDVMNRSVRSVLLTPVLVSALSAGCMSAPSSVTGPDPPFVFRSLDLSQRREDGSRDWELSSPEARYDLNSRTVEAEGPAGLIFRAMSPICVFLPNGSRWLTMGNGLFRGQRSASTAPGPASGDRRRSTRLDSGRHRDGC